MKLLQCKIENFGKLSDVSFDFSEGVNTFCEENGWGKSTLANFIRIMFFGFLNGNKQDKLVNEESVISRGRVRKACMAEVLNSKQREKVIS